MNIHNIFGLATIGLTAALVAACSSNPPPIGGSEDEVEEPAPSGAKLPSGGTPKAPSKPGDNAGTPSGGTPSTSGQPGKPGDPGPAGDPGKPADPVDPGQPGQPGQVGRISVNEHCCYGGTYFKCPSSAACFGGFDINACLSSCAGPQDPCFDACFDKLDSAGAPKGCQSNVTPPKGVDCANGQINL